MTVIAGYLGAGKTTLINQLLAGDHGRRLAVLVNDFGAVNIDADLITSHDGSTISLSNGCICCSIADALGEALDQVLALDPRPDQILIESSGVSDPIKVAAYGQGWPGCRLDAVIVLADAETVRERSRDQFVGELVTRQIGRADLVIVTKCDLVSDSVLDSVVDWLRDEIVGAPILTHRVDEIDPILLLEPSLTQDSTRRRRQSANDDSGLNSVPEFESMVLEIDHPVDRTRFEATLRSWPDTVLRVKCIVRLGPEPAQLHVVQRVGLRLTVEDAPSAIDESHIGKLVVLGLSNSVSYRDLRSSLDDL